MNEQQKVKGIFTFNMIAQSEIEKLEKQYSIKILPSKITGGRRWSYSGSVHVEIPVGESKRIKINDNYGVIIYNWQLLSDLQKNEIEEILLKNE